MKFTYQDLKDYFSVKKYPMQNQMKVLEEKFCTYLKKDQIDKNQIFYVIAISLQDFLRDRPFVTDAYVPNRTFIDAEKDFFKKLSVLPLSLVELGIDQNNAMLLADYNHIACVFDQNKSNFIVSISDYQIYLVLFDQSMYNLINLTSKSVIDEWETNPSEKFKKLGNLDLWFEFNLSLT